LYQTIKQINMPQITFYIKKEDQKLRDTFENTTSRNGRRNYSEVIVDLMKLYEQKGESLFKPKNTFKK